MNLLEYDVDTLVVDIKGVVLSTAHKVRGREREKKQPWVTNNILNLYVQKKDLERERKKNQEATSNFK